MGDVGYGEFDCFFKFSVLSCELNVQGNLIITCIF